MNIFNLYKPLGWTPLQALKQLRKLNPSLQQLPLTYAGRLDPMAEGVLLVLAGEQASNREPFLKLDKTYSATFLLGVKTDSGDMLGISGPATETNFSANELRSAAEKLAGVHELEVPAFSSMPLLGKPLFVWAREGKKVTLPKRDMQVFAVGWQGANTAFSSHLLRIVENKIGSVSGDFRQEAVVQRWNQVLSENLKLQTVSVELHCASGAYVRSLAGYFGSLLGASASLLHLQRTQVGQYTLAEAQRLT